MNWTNYNQNFVKRGQIFVNMDVIGSLQRGFQEKNSKPKRGRPYSYPTILIILAMLAKFSLSLPYRHLEGFLKSLKSILGKLGIKIPNFRTFQYRFSKLSPDLKELFDGKGINFEELPDGFVVVLDTT